MRHGGAAPPAGGAAGGIGGGSPPCRIAAPPQGQPHVLYARGQRGHARGVRGANRPGADRRPRDHADPRPRRGSLALPRRPGGAAALGQPTGRTGRGEDAARPRRDAGATTSHAGTIWTGSATPGSGRAPVYARTSITRVDPVYVAEVSDSVIIADRATWVAWTASRLDAHDPLHVAALLNPGFPLGSATPFTRVSALTSATTLHLLNGALTRLPTPKAPSQPRPRSPLPTARAPAWRRPTPPRARCAASKVGPARWPRRWSRPSRTW